MRMPRMRLIAGAAAAALIGLLAAATPAHADPTPTGTLQWGFKQSFRGYVSGFGGTTSPVAPATGSGVMSFPLTGVSDDSATFSGGIRFLVASHGVDITLANLKIEKTGDTTGKLIADVTTSAGTQTGVHLADLTVAQDDDGKEETQLFAATITAHGTDIFGASYPPGTALDPVKVLINLVSGSPAPPAASPTPGGSLPTTGVDSTLAAGIGLLLIALGFAAVLVARRRHA